MGHAPSSRANGLRGRAVSRDSVGGGCPPIWDRCVCLCEGPSREWSLKKSPHCQVSVFSERGLRGRTIGDVDLSARTCPPWLGQHREKISSIVRWPVRGHLEERLSPVRPSARGRPALLRDLCASVFPSSGEVLKHRETEDTERGERGESKHRPSLQRRDSIGRRCHRFGSAGASPSRMGVAIAVGWNGSGLLRVGRARMSAYARFDELPGGPCHRRHARARATCRMNFPVPSSRRWDRALGGRERNRR